MGVPKFQAFLPKSKTVFLETDTNNMRIGVLADVSCLFVHKNTKAKRKNDKQKAQSLQFEKGLRFVTVQEWGQIGFFRFADNPIL